MLTEKECRIAIDIAFRYSQLLEKKHRKLVAKAEKLRAELDEVQDISSKRFGNNDEE